MGATKLGALLGPLLVWSAVQTAGTPRRAAQQQTWPLDCLAALGEALLAARDDSEAALGLLARMHEYAPEKWRLEDVQKSRLFLAIMRTAAAPTVPADVKDAAINLAQSLATNSSTTHGERNDQEAGNEELPQGPTQKPAATPSAEEPQQPRQEQQQRRQLRPRRMCQPRQQDAGPTPRQQPRPRRQPAGEQDEAAESRAPQRGRKRKQLPGGNEDGSHRTFFAVPEGAADAGTRDLLTPAAGALCGQQEPATVIKLPAKQLSSAADREALQAEFDAAFQGDGSVVVLWPDGTPMLIAKRRAFEAGLASAFAEAFFRQHQDSNHKAKRTSDVEDKLLLPMALAGFRACRGNTSQRIEAAVAGPFPQMLDDPQFCSAVYRTAVALFFALLQQGGQLATSLKEQFAAVVAWAGALSSLALIPGTPWTTVAVTVTPFNNTEHDDKQDLGLSSISWFERGSGSLQGGAFVLHGVLKFVPEPGTAILLDSAHVRHYTEPAVLVAGDRQRIGVALFASKATMTGAVNVWKAAQAATHEEKLKRSAANSKKQGAAAKEKKGAAAKKEKNGAAAAKKEGAAAKKKKGAAAAKKARC